jgi:hypothetical protein
MVVIGLRSYVPLASLHQENNPSYMVHRLLQISEIFSQVLLGCYPTTYLIIIIKYIPGGWLLIMRFVGMGEVFWDLKCVSIDY